MGEVISVFEYDLLGSGKAASVGAKPVPPQVFNYLEALSLEPPRVSWRVFYL